MHESDDEVDDHQNDGAQPRGKYWKWNVWRMQHQFNHLQARNIVVHWLLVLCQIKIDFPCVKEQSWEWWEWIELYLAAFGGISSSLKWVLFYPLTMLVCIECHFWPFWSFPKFNPILNKVIERVWFWNTSLQYEEFLSVSKLYCEKRKIILNDIWIFSRNDFMMLSRVWKCDCLKWRVYHQTYFVEANHEWLGLIQSANTVFRCCLVMLRFLFSFLSLRHREDTKTLFPQIGTVTSEAWN